MKCRIRYSEAAVRDLERVHSEVYDASKSNYIAAEYINDMLDKVELKADFPKSGSPLYYGNDFTGYYFVVFKAYMIFYRIDGDVLLVDRILYGKSDYMRSLKLGHD